MEIIDVLTVGVELPWCQPNFFIVWIFGNLRVKSKKLEMSKHKNCVFSVELFTSLVNYFLLPHFVNRDAGEIVGTIINILGVSRGAHYGLTTKNGVLLKKLPTIFHLTGPIRMQVKLYEFGGVNES